MGYMFMLCACYTCGRQFSCNPELVPALPAAITNSGEKEPVCESCVRIANPQRLANGLEPINVLPGAYEPQEI